MNQEEIAQQIVDAALKVHKALGPGLLESAYQVCFAYELKKRGLNVQTEVPQTIWYEHVCLESGYRIDMLVEDQIIIENKAVDSLAPIYFAQLMTYLKHRNCSLGFLINWNVTLIKDGIRRVVNRHPTMPMHHSKNTG